ncbi:MAG: cytochrome c biogenesis protein CcsA [Phycisphaerales bacterium]|nr:cytochrome c biogenesis protein CcsA [Phycisphaerales bacterium]
MMNKIQQILPWIVLVLAVLYAGQRVVRPERIESAFDLERFRQLPVSASGRTKPLDTVARNSLMKMSGRQSIQTDEGTVSAIEWYIELITDPEASVQRRVFRIDHPDVLAMIGLDKEKRTRFSFEELRIAGNEINRQAGLAFETKAKSRDPFQRAILVLNQRMSLFSELSQLLNPYLVPPLTSGAEEWRSFVTVLNESPNDPDAMALLTILQDYRAANLEGATEEEYEAGRLSFNTSLGKFAGLIERKLPYEARKSRYEVIFNQVQPFIIASTLFLIAFLFGCFGMLSSQLTKKEWSKSLFNSMTSLLVVALIVQTIGLVSRVYLQGRPPITNLYSSAVFTGWGCVIIGLIIDRQMKLGLGGIMASVIGFGTLVVAHNLGSSGDTMEMMQAVLDSNFWLTTHVVVVTIGYSGTFFAGFLGIAYVLLGVFTKMLDRELGKSMVKMTYGVICFATVTSFAGTVLGGIWADQSWGRFWGWDAKENGAALIVLWNLLILHARWGGMIRDRGLVVLAIFGNIVTAWSWFGTNMLGVGLHAYGFTSSTVFWLTLFVLSQIVLMGVGMLPMTIWRSKFAKPILPNS